MHTRRNTIARFGLLAIAALALGALYAFGIVTPAPEHVGALMLANAGGVDLSAIMKTLEGVEAKLADFDKKASEELRLNGKVSTDTKAAVDKLGTDQRELADRLLALEQKGLLPADGGAGTGKGESWGEQFIKSGGDALNAFRGNNSKHVSVVVKNTITNTVGNTPDQMRPGIVSGPSRILRLEDLFTHLPCSSDAVQYVRENVFTNAAAETAEAGTLPESSVTTTLVTEPVATIGHFLKISRQLAADNPALTVYVNTRLRYGVDLRVDNQIFGGNGTAPNMSGMTKAGNFTAHGYTAASLTALGLLNNRFDLIGKMIGDCAVNDYPADAIVLNPADWWTMRLAKDSQGRYIFGDPGMVIAPVLFGLPVVASNAVTADNVAVLSAAQAGTFYDREQVEIAMSEHDGDNFQKLLVTLRAHRRCMLAIERPAAIRYGDLTPA